MSFGIDFDSILASLWHQNLCVFVDRFIFYDFFDLIFIDFDPKWLPKLRLAEVQIRSFLAPVLQGVFSKFPFGSMLVVLGILPDTSWIFLE